MAEDSGRLRSNRDDRQQWRKQTWLGRFVSTYGWRAYALPALAVVTGIVVYQSISGPAPVTPAHPHVPMVGQPTINSASTAIVGAPPKGLTQFDVNLPTGICKDLTEEQYEGLYRGCIVHEKPLTNALGPDFKQILTRENLIERYKGI